MDGSHLKLIYEYYFLGCERGQVGSCIGIFTVISEIGAALTGLSVNDGDSIFGLLHLPTILPHT